jgi:hypothetical protein
VTAEFAPRANGRYEGKLSGLSVGNHELETTSDAGGARITITNHPAGGPVFSGPQIQPWTCSAGALDAQCNRPVAYTYYYRSTDPSVCNGGPALPVALPVSPSSCYASYDPAHPAANVATTTTDEGVTVPYIVRLETGYQDRDQYQIAALFDPAHEPTPWDPQPQWNHKLEITHGAACGVAHGDGTAPSVLDDRALSRGFAVMSTALDNAGHNCNIAVQAESLVMAKERVIEQLGEIRYTIATGCSGGSLTQDQVANAYPGVYDGIMPECTFPDAWSSAMDVIDCFLMEQYWENPTSWSPGVVWTERDQAAAGGHFSDSVCHAWKEVFPFWETGLPTKPAATDGLDLQGCGVPADQVYDPQTNPTGVRCSLADYMVNVFGVRSQDGFANRPFSNVGVQYGLQALAAGQISVPQFVDLNAKSGGRDIDFNQTAARTQADAFGVDAAYRSGAVNEATQLDKVAIIDEPNDNVEIHEEYRAWALSSRLDHAFGTHANHVIWYGEAASKPSNFLAMDRWLAAVEADHRAVPKPQKIIDDKPTDVTDHCYIGNEDVPSQDTCQKLMGPWTGTRAAAGGPFSGDVVQCALKALQPADYFPVQFSNAQWATLQQTFPTGVCDWSKPGVSQQPTVPWQTYGTATSHIYGGQPLGDPPVSTST